MRRAGVRQSVRPSVRLSVPSIAGKRLDRYLLAGAGLTMWQMWQMPRASGLRGASGSRENFFQPVSSQVI